MKPCVGCRHESCERCLVHEDKDKDGDENEDEHEYPCCVCKGEREFWDFLKCHGCGHDVCNDCSWVQGWDDQEKEMGKISACDMQ